MSKTKAERSAEELPNNLLTTAHLLDEFARKPDKSRAAVRRDAVALLQGLPPKGRPLHEVEPVQRAMRTLGLLAGQDNLSVPAIVESVNALVSQAEEMRSIATDLEEGRTRPTAPRPGRKSSPQKSVQRVEPLATIDIPRVLSPRDEAFPEIMRSVVAALDSYHFNLTAKAKLDQRNVDPNGQQRKRNTANLKSSITGLSKVRRVVSAMQRAGNQHGTAWGKAWATTLGKLIQLEQRWAQTSAAERRSKSPFSASTVDSLRSSVAEVTRALPEVTPVPSADKGGTGHALT